MIYPITIINNLEAIPEREMSRVENYFLNRCVMKNSKEAVRFEEIFPAIDFLTAELDKIRGGTNAAPIRCEKGIINCDPTGIIDNTELQISAF